MRFPSGQLRRRLFGIEVEETIFARQGFYQGDKRTQAQFYQIIRTFLQGYHLALEDDHFEVLIPSLERIEAEFRGFAFEGAAMGLTFFDFFFPWKCRFQNLLQGPGANYSYELHIGAGWTLKWLPRNHTRFLRQFDPLLAWLVMDGYGFYQGFSSWRHVLRDHAYPVHLSGYTLRAFDQGLGRSLWFVKGADAPQIIDTIQAFPSSRQSDLWSGIGVACAYAGGMGSDALQALRDAAGVDRPHLAQGAIFAAMARKQGGNPVVHTDLACEILSGFPCDEAIDLTNKSLQGLPQNEHAYEIWRSRVRSFISQNPVGHSRTAEDIVIKH